MSEEVAAFAAGAEAHLTGELAVCAGSCGPGNLHLINGLFDCYRSRVPVLGIAAQIPSAEIGSGYFQETHPQALFQECSHYCELVAGPNQMPRALYVAMREAVGKRGVSVLVLPGDVALQTAADGPPPKVGGLLPPAPVVAPSPSDLDRLAALLNGDKRVTILRGSGCQGAHDEVLALGERLAGERHGDHHPLKARVVVIATVLPISMRNWTRRREREYYTRAICASRRENMRSTSHAPPTEYERMRMRASSAK